MQTRPFVNTLLIAAALATFTATPARAQVDIDAKAQEVAKSLVIVEYTLRNENVAREESGQGILIHADGVILISGSLINESIPRDYIKDIKVRLPQKNFASIPVKFLGRTQDRVFAFLKADKPLDGVAVLDTSHTADTKLGRDVFSVGRLSKSGGYEPYVGVSANKALITVTHKLAGTGSFGLTRANSPVYDRQSGELIGFTYPPQPEAMILRDSTGIRPVEITDADQSGIYIVWDDMKDVFKDIPTKPFESRRPWIGIDGMTGLEEEVRTHFGIAQPVAVQIGSVIPNEAADKAGLKTGDVITSIDGTPFSTSPVPDLMVTHFSRALEKHQPGDEIKLAVLRDRGQTKVEIKVKLGTSPKTAPELPLTFSPKIGISTRDLVFADAYARKLPQDTKGVMVVLVKQGTPASLGSTPLRAGVLITKINDQPVDDQKQFLQLLKKEEEKPDLKELVFVVTLPNAETQVCRVDLTK